MTHQSHPLSAIPLVDCYVLDTGYCVASERVVIKGGRAQDFDCHAIVALFQHPQHGWILWDTGYAPRIFDATRLPPWRLQRITTPLRLDQARSVLEQLSDFGLSASDIRYVILSHFHADHIAGLRDFPEAELIASAEAYADVAPRKGMNAMIRGFIPALMPEDFRERARLLPPFHGPELAPFGASHDLFNDGSLRLVNLPGHAKGQLGLLVQSKQGELFFCADGAWLRESIRRQAPPASIASLIVDDAKEVALTISRLHQFSLLHPETVLIPSHCPEAFAEWVTDRQTPQTDPLSKQKNA
jgi:glyoxylase-like metal-dependent hydrolase (beta-lactamase superfamily II)